jgi:hypothetical protein
MVILFGLPTPAQIAWQGPEPAGSAPYMGWLRVGFNA